MKQLGVIKKGNKFYTKIYGTEYELILPKEKDAKAVKKGSKKGQTNKETKPMAEVPEMVENK